jgi:membrane protease YdiL (CAAX protease family)
MIRRHPREALSRDEWALCGAALAVSGILNGQLPAPLRVPAGLAACGLVGWLARRTGVEQRKLGLSKADAPRGVSIGLAVGIPLSAAIVLGAVTRSTRGLYAAQPIAEASPSRALYEAFVRIPMGTALPEEFIFRGALLGALSQDHDFPFAIALSSLVFGLWHLRPALRQSGPQGYRLSSMGHRTLHAAASVAGTSLAGVGFAVLRLRAGSLLAPWLVHAAVNGSGYLSGWLVRRSQWRTVPRSRTTRCRTSS